MQKMYIVQERSSERDIITGELKDRRLIAPDIGVYFLDINLPSMERIAGYVNLQLQDTF